MMACIGAIASSHHFLADESLSRLKIINAIWIKPGKKVTQLNAIQISKVLCMEIKK